MCVLSLLIFLPNGYHIHISFTCLRIHLYSLFEVIKLVPCAELLLCNCSVPFPIIFRLLCEIDNLRLHC